MKKLLSFIFLLVFVTACDGDVDLSGYVPNEFPIERMVYSNSCLFSGINVFQIDKVFSEKFEKDVYKPNLIAHMRQGKIFEELKPWQKTPVNTEKLHDVDKAWGTISATSECFEKNKYSNIYDDSLKGHHSFFTTNSGVVLIYNYRKNLLFVSSWD